MKNVVKFAIRTNKLIRKLTCKIIGDNTHKALNESIKRLESALDNELKQAGRGRH